MQSQVNQFVAITHVSTSQAENLLKRSNNDLQVALNEYFRTSRPESSSFNKINSFFSEIAQKNETLEGDNLVHLSQAIGVDLMDPVWLAVACECNAAQMGVFTRNEWLVGLSATNADPSVAGLKTAFPALKKKLAKDDQFAKRVYKFAFQYSLDQGSRNLKKEEAVALWDLLMKPRKWKYYDQWISFVDKKFTHNINKDIWNMIWELSEILNRNDIDGADAWPVAIDEFLESLKEM